MFPNLKETKPLAFLMTEGWFYFSFIKKGDEEGFNEAYFMPSSVASKYW